MAEDIATGGCSCGAVRFSFPRTAVLSAAHCHCRDCQRATGSAFATFCFVPEAAFMIEGEPKGYTVHGESGQGVVRSFCPTCGSQLFSQVEVMPGVYFVKAGVLDDASWVEPASSYWASSAQPWCTPNPDIPAHDKNPG